MNDYKTELDLADAGFVLTPNIWHTGKGSGKVFEKIVDEVRVFYGVDVDGAVMPLSFTGGQPTVVAPVEATPEVVEPAVEPEATPEAPVE